VAFNGIFPNEHNAPRIHEFRGLRQDLGDDLAAVDLGATRAVVCRGRVLKDAVDQASGAFHAVVEKPDHLLLLDAEPSATDEPAAELVRLRAEVESLRQQTKEIETLRADTRDARAATEIAAKTKSASHLANSVPGSSANASQFEVLSADYWTEKTNMDVATELRDRIRGDSLKAIANNNLKGDPDFGQVKHLTVVYRSGGATFTNEFREGDFIVLPPQPQQ
jgi:hypothetical protein